MDWRDPPPPPAPAARCERHKEPSRSRMFMEDFRIDVRSRFRPKPELGTVKNLLANEAREYCSWLSYSSAGSLLS